MVHYWRKTIPRYDQAGHNPKSWDRQIHVRLASLYRPAYANAGPPYVACLFVMMSVRTGKLLMQVMVNLHSAHMDPDDWQQTQQFRPERFLNESGSVINRDRVIAFSLGNLTTTHILHLHSARGCKRFTV